jgi:hypothetical protein
LSVGRSGTTNKTVRLPKNFTLLGPGLGYSCSQAKIVPSTVFLTSDGRRKTQAMSKSASPEKKFYRQPKTLIYFHYKPEDSLLLMMKVLVDDQFKLGNSISYCCVTLS